MTHSEAIEGFGARPTPGHWSVSGQEGMCILRAVCYICAMISKGLMLLAMLSALTQTPQNAAGQSNSHAAANQPGAKAPAQVTSSAPTAAGSTASTATPSTAPTAPSNCEGAGCDYQPAHITVATAAPHRPPGLFRTALPGAPTCCLRCWDMRASCLAFKRLKRSSARANILSRQPKLPQRVLKQHVKSAEAALLHAQAIINAERPWVLITIVPSRSIENGFTVIATNRGRGPAQVVAASEETRIAIDETHLPSLPEFKSEDAETPFVSIILLPGEFMNLKSFCRDDVKALCGSDEAFRRIENWEERIFLYGKVTYRDLAAPTDRPPHETGWCCRYIHGRQKSGLVMAGSHEYNVHT